MPGSQEEDEEKSDEGQGQESLAPVVALGSIIAQSSKAHDLIKLGYGRAATQPLAEPGALLKQKVA